MVAIIAAIIYVAFGLEWHDLRWATNQESYKVLLILIGLLIAVFLNYKFWLDKNEGK